MSSPYVGECRLVGFNFAPVGWALCNGQQMPISEYDTLFNLIGTTYGGNGQTTFLLPDLQGRAPVHQGTGLGGVVFVIAQNGGQENVTVTVPQMPSHSHPLVASSANGNANLFQNQVLAGSSSAVYQNSPDPKATMNAASITSTGGSQPHSNLQPYLVMNWIISLFGIYPSQT